MDFEDEDSGPAPKPWQTFQHRGPAPNPVPTTGKRVWKSVDELGQDLESIGFKVTKSGKSLAVKFDFVWHAPASGGPFGSEWADISGQADVVDGAARLKLKLWAHANNGWTAGQSGPNYTRDDSYDLGTIFATNRASLMHQIVSELKKSGAPKGIADRFKYLADGRGMGRKLIGKSQDRSQGVDRSPQGDRSAAARKGVLTLGKSLGTRRLPEGFNHGLDMVGPGDSIEIIYNDKILVELMVVDQDRDYTTAVTWGGETYLLDHAEIEDQQAHGLLEIEVQGEKAYIDLTAGYDTRDHAALFLQQMMDDTVTNDQKARIRAELDKIR